MNLTLSARIVLLIAVALFAALGMALAPPIAQPHSYHNFADQRTWLGIPNFANVTSNLTFLLVGAWGLTVSLRKNIFLQPAERWPYIVLFLALILTGFGSAYYHWHPDNDRLVWDRLPITLVVMALTAAVIAERIRVRAGLALLPLLLLLGAASVWQWQHSETLGAGDLRFYLYVQFFPMVGVPLMMALFPARYTRSSYIFGLIGLYVVAKVCELFDRTIYTALNSSLSGHTLKHLIAAAATGCIALMVARRKPCSASP